MGVVVTPIASKLQIKYIGDVVEGSQKYISKTYARLKPTANDQNIFDIANVIASLQTKTLYSLHKVVESNMIEE